MKASVEAISGTERRIRIEIPAEEVARRIEQGYAEVRKIAPLRGFRKGKAPMSMVKRAFKEHVEADVAEHLVKESLADAVRRNDLKVLSMGRIDGGPIREGEEFAFTATVEVIPAVEPADYKGIPVVREKIAVTDADVDAALAGLRESFSSYHAVEGRGAYDRDLVEFGYRAVTGGEEVDKAESASTLLGNGFPFGLDFEGKLAGARPGDQLALEVAYPADFRNPKFAGKTVTFSVTVHAVREKRLPPLDDEFARNFSDVTGGLAELRERMRRRLLGEAEERARLRMEEEIRKGLADRNPVEIPKTLVDRRIAEMIEEAADRMTAQGIDLKKVRLDFEKMRERFAPGAERAVRVSLLMEAIARKENVDVPFSEIEEEMKAIAAAAKTDYEKVRELYGDEDRMDDLRNRLLGRKVMAFLIAHADMKEEGVDG